MLLTITTTRTPATDLGYLLHKHPARFQSFDLSFGRAHVFYPQTGDDVCTVALLLEADPIGLARDAKRFRTGLLDQYVNDRPYVASSFMSVAIAQVFGTALGGRCTQRPELAETSIPLTARISCLPCRGGENFVRSVFEPLGYGLNLTRRPLDEQYPQWGESPYYAVELSKTATLCELLTHLYVLIPVFDHRKHYYVGPAEMDKLLARGGGWLASHPQREAITRRFLKHAPSLARTAIERLAEADGLHADEASAEDGPPEGVEAKPPRLNDQRMDKVLAALRDSGAASVLDLGCGEGGLLQRLLADTRFTRIIGMDVSIRALEIASARLKLDRLPREWASRVELIHGSLAYRDKRLAGFDAAAVVEVVEHLGPSRLKAFERALFEFARPATVVLTTVNRDYNVLFESLPAGEFRHGDHRFEWSRAEFQRWAAGISEHYGYRVRFQPVGPEDDTHGAPTQMAIFDLDADRI